jgi:hypothetical protein
LVSKLAFKWVNLRRYDAGDERVAEAIAAADNGGGCVHLEMQLTHSLKAPGFKP